MSSNDEDEALFLDTQIQLSKITRATVMRIACSDKHAMVVTNTGAVYTWGENDFSQLGYNTPK